MGGGEWERRRNGGLPRGCGWVKMMVVAVASDFDTSPFLSSYGGYAAASGGPVTYMRVGARK